MSYVCSIFAFCPVMLVHMSVIYVDNISNFGWSICFWQIRRLSRKFLFQVTHNAIYATDMIICKIKTVLGRTENINVIFKRIYGSNFMCLNFHTYERLQKNTRQVFSVNFLVYKLINSKEMNYYYEH